MIHKLDLPWAWLKHSHSKQAPFLPICCLNWCCYCGLSLASPRLGKHCHLESSRQMSPLSHDRIPLIPGIPSQGCLLLNELLLSTQLNGVVRNWKLSLLQLLVWQDFFSSLLPVTVSGTHAVLQIWLRPALNCKRCKCRSSIHASATHFSFFQQLGHGQLD